MTCFNYIVNTEKCLQNVLSSLDQPAFAEFTCKLIQIIHLETSNFLPGPANCKDAGPELVSWTVNVCLLTVSTARDINL